MQMEYSFHGKHGGITAIPQSGLRHAIALEKLINSHESQDSVLKDLKNMVPRSRDNNPSIYEMVDPTMAGQQSLFT